MLCLCCVTSIEAAYEALKPKTPSDDSHQSSSIHHESLSDFYQSIMEECWICQQLWALMLHYSNSEKAYESDFSKHDRYEPCFDAEFKALQRWESRGDLPTRLEMFSSGYTVTLTLRTTRYKLLNLKLTPKPKSANGAELNISARRNIAPTSASTSESSQLWNQWFRTCSKLHEECGKLDHKQQLFSPKRLVEIFTDDKGDSFNWRIVCGADIDGVSYLTLSHCWGSSGHKCLTKNNQSDLSKLSNYSNLPKSFQHAFSISFSLGFRFVWIDSLCIVQDDPDDWETQASMMGTIYKYASCNIAATWARDGNDGCFTTKREPRTITLYAGHHYAREYEVNSRLPYYEDIVEAPLNQRGWVTQERFLARRQLSFAQGQVYWECRGLVASEQYPEGFPTTLQYSSPYNQAEGPTGSIAKPTLDYTTEEDHRAAWAALVDFYSDCRFTRSSDKMIALAGLAEEMRDAMDDVYLAGMWKKNIQRQLCWSTDCDVRKHFNRSRMPTYLAPTWSWASVNGPVMSDKVYHFLDDSVSCVEILEATVHSQHPDGLHSFVASRLRMRGVAIWAQAIRSGKTDGPIDEDDWELQATGLNTITLGNVETNIPISILWDENISSSEVNPGQWLDFLDERSSTLLFIFIYMDAHNTTACGLVLRRLSSTTDEILYGRIGTFRDFRRGFSNLLSARLGYPAGQPITEDLNLDHADLKDLVQIVTVM
jgi:hypothetical protein